jgi:hypothetical protein
MEYSFLELDIWNFVWTIHAAKEKYSIYFPVQIKNRAEISPPGTSVQRLVE